ncbi:hypothetical protein [Streptomyces sp. NPDC047966]
MALAGTGLLTTVGVIVAMDTFGPVSDKTPCSARSSSCWMDNFSSNQ